MISKHVILRPKAEEFRSLPVRQAGFATLRMTCAFFILFFSTVAWAEAPALQEMTAAFHVHSEVSGSHDQMSELAIRAHQKGIDAVILSDYYEQRVELGFFPFHHWLKVWYEKPSIRRHGIKHFFEEVEKVNRDHPETLLIPGAEVTPAYWWSGNLFSGNLTLHNIQKNLLVFGIGVEDYEKIPTVSNGLSRADAYHLGKEGEQPYQQVIDYVAQKNGFVLWSTPDENPATDMQRGPVHFKTEPYFNSLLATEHYTGVCALPEGFIETGRAGGAWDKTLAAYCRGKRKTPPWIFAELILHQLLPIDMDHRYIAAWVREKNEKELFDAIRRGHFYAFQRSMTSRLKLNEFSVIKTGSSVHIKASVAFIKEVPTSVEVKLIRMGEIIRTERGNGGVTLDFADDLTDVSENKIYYRLEARGAEPETGILLSNPIFVSRHE